MMPVSPGKTSLPPLDAATLERIQQTRLFHDVDPTVLSQLVQKCHRVTYDAGEPLFLQDAPGDALYLLLQGCVSVRKDRVEIVRRCSGECVGEMALIDDGPRSASVIAVEPTQALAIPRDLFWEMLENHPSVARHLLRVMTARLRQDIQREIEARREQILQQHEIERAAQIQRHLFPQGDLHTSYGDFSGVCLPAATIGGDYYDYFLLPDGRVGCIIADVVGHGLDAALLVAILRSSLRTQIRTDPSIQAVMTTLNEAIIEINHVMEDVRRWVLYGTCCYAIFERGGLYYINAAHPSPLLWQDGQVYPLESTHLPLGLHYMNPVPYRAKWLPWTRDALLTFYSDGVLETTNDQGEAFGLERLEDLLTTLTSSPPERVNAHILQAIRDHRGEQPLEDDITLITARYAN